MTITQAEAPEASTETQAEQLTERLFNDAVVVMETFNVHLGVVLGLYRALADGPADARELAERARIHPRYAREWLEQQAVAGVLHAEHGDDADPYGRTFSLPEGHRETLLNEDSPYFLGGMPGFVVSIGRVVDEVAAAFRTGGGVSYEAYGALTRHGIAGMNRPMYNADLAGWIAAMPDIEQRLASRRAQILDLGCGTGASSIALARLFPQAQVRGVDLDAASVAEATENAKAAAIEDRVTFELADAAEVGGTGRYQLTCVFESLHDMADPVAALRAARALVDPAGAVLVADERVAEQFASPGDIVERLNYGFSVLHCLPATRAEGTAVEAGTVLRPGTVREYAEKAGFDCTVLPIDNDLWRFYRLGPA